MRTLLGKELKAPKWTVVESSVKQLSASAKKQVQTIVAHEGEYGMYCTVTLKDRSYVSFKVDARCVDNLADGVLCDIDSFMVYDMTNGEKTISRCYAEPAE